MVPDAILAEGVCAILLDQVISEQIMKHIK